MRNISQDSQNPGQYMSWALPEYESAALLLHQPARFYRSCFASGKQTHIGLYYGNEEHHLFTIAKQ
jgi:hypothetical protein